MAFCKYLPHASENVNKSSRNHPEISGTSPQGNFFFQPDYSSPSTRTRKPTRTRDVQKQYKVDSTEFNIFHIDDKIQEKLKGNIDTLPLLVQELGKAKWIMDHGTPTERVQASHNVSKLRSKIQDIETTFELGFYILQTNHLLEEYRQIVNSSSGTSFVKTRSSHLDEHKRRKNEILSRFLKIAKEYIDISNYTVEPQKLECSCGSSDFRFDIDTSVYICKTCATEHQVLDDSPAYKDTDRVNMSSRYIYTRKGHLIDAMKRFQGIQNTDPVRIERVVQILQDEIKLHNLSKDKVTKDHLYMFLSEKGLSQHYEDLNLLYHIITGEKCPDISHLEDELIDLFIKQEEAYRQVKTADRTNSLNVNYKLYKLLQKVGFPCKKDDFYILKTKVKEDEHDETMQKAWAYLGWDWIPTA